jgi:UDP-N-acetyl-D-galactosamine dehydrogenase
MIFAKLNINTYEVLEAAGTKWNFLKFVPGLVGGHCIGVDPYYLTYKAKALGIDPAVIAAGRRINDGMPAYAAKKIAQKLISLEKDMLQTRVLVMGATFKEDVNDIRNSKVAELVRELEAYSMQVDVIDPLASPKEMDDEYGIKLTASPTGRYDAIILATPHKAYLKLELVDLQDLLAEGGLIADLKGVWRNKVGNLPYLSL